MPIRIENRHRYPKDWPAIRARILARARNRCEGCTVRNHALGGRARDGSFKRAMPIGFKGSRNRYPKPGAIAWCYGHRVAPLRIIRIVLTVAHLDHTPENCADENLRALCQRCHNRYDAAMRRAGILARRRELAAIGDLFGAAA